MTGTASLPRLVAVTRLGGGAFMAEFIGALEDGRVVYAKRRAGRWVVNAGSTIDDALWPGASDPERRARLRGMSFPDTMRFDGCWLGTGSGPLVDPPSAEADLAGVTRGILDITGVRWVAAPHDADADEIAALVLSAAR